MVFFTLSCAREVYHCGTVCFFIVWLSLWAVSHVNIINVNAYLFHILSLLPVSTLNCVFFLNIYGYIFIGLICLMGKQVFVV